jgi:CrcB protein
MKYFLIALGGALGTLLRYGISNAILTLTSGAFPLGTLMVNISGSFVIGYLWGMNSVISFQQNLSAFLFIGLLGGFTTFSSFSIESLQLLKEGDTRAAFIYIFSSCIGGLLAAYLGIRLTIHRT